MNFLPDPTVPPEPETEPTPKIANVFLPISLFSPFIEQTALSEIVTAFSAHRHAWDNNAQITITVNGANTVIQNPYKTMVGAFLCPSDSTGFAIAEDVLKGTNYSVCQGDWATGAPNVGNGIQPDPSTRGIFAAKENRSMGSITDGTSNTIAVLERAIGRNNNNDVAIVSVIINRTTAIDNVAVPAGATNTTPITNFPNVNPDDCRATAASGKNYNTGLAYTRTLMTRWGDGAPSFCGMGTIMPPNAPGCRYSDDNSYHLYGPTSKHTSGVNGALADGSVRFITDSVNATTAGVTYPVRLITSGPSLFGVWGGMGSMSGGESTTL